MAAETKQIVEAGEYTIDGNTVDIGASIDRARRASHLHLPDDPTLAVSPPTGRRGALQITGETTLQAAGRLVASENASVACLNFASAKHAGGGYLKGSQAQEESLARSSALVTCLEVVPEFYDFHRRQSDPVYSHRMICSPDVPVFRDEAGDLLRDPYLVTFLTATAPNAGALTNRRRSPEVRQALTERARRVLSAAALHDHRTLVLGAWGCGVFRNDPAVVADVFGALLDGAFATAFDHVTFAVLDTQPGTPTRAAFEHRLTQREALA